MNLIDAEIFDLLYEAYCKLKGYTTIKIRAVPKKDKELLIAALKTILQIL